MLYNYFDKSQFTIYPTGVDGLQVGSYLLFTGLNTLQQILHCVLAANKQSRIHLFTNL